MEEASVQIPFLIPPLLCRVLIVLIFTLFEHPFFFATCLLLPGNLTKIGKFQVFLRSSIFTELQNIIKPPSPPYSVGPITLTVVLSIIHKSIRVHPEPWASEPAASQGPSTQVCVLQPEGMLQNILAWVAMCFGKDLGWGFGNCVL